MVKSIQINELVKVDHPLGFLLGQAVPSLHWENTWTDFDVGKSRFICSVIIHHFITYNVKA